QGTAMASHVELLFGVLQDLGNDELKQLQWFLRQPGIVDGFPAIPKSELQEADRQDTVDLMMQTYGLPAALHITAEVLKKISRNDLVEHLSKSASEPNKLYIIDWNDVDVNRQHEVRHIEMTSRKPGGAERAIQHNDIFQHHSGENIPVRTVLTNGIAGIGKTFLVSKFILDWAEGRANQNVHLIFPFTFRQLNLLSGRRFRLAELVHTCIRESRDITEELDFSEQVERAVDEPLLVNELLANLIKGKFLPSARLWITTRPAAANQIPPDSVDIMTEVRGFTDTQKEEYFRKRFSDEEQATRIISHIKTSRSLHIMCHIPVFCWITATVFKKMFGEDESREIPQTLTEMYIKFLMFQIKQTEQKYDKGRNFKVIHSLAKLAFHELQRGHLIFYESDLRSSGICSNEASVYSGVFTQIFKEEDRLNEDKMFCFVHLSIHEFLAAVFVVLSVCMKAVDKALQSPNGHLDLFLRFLLGLSLQSNQDLLQGLLKEGERSADTQKKLVAYIKEKIRENSSPERCINLFHCLSELKDSSLVEEVRHYLRTDSLSTALLSPAQWSALVYLLLSSDEDLDVFDLKKYSRSEEVLLRMLPLVKASTTALVLLPDSSPISTFHERSCSPFREHSCHCALLDQCKFSQRSCEALASVLRSSGSLKNLDLSYNNLQDGGLLLYAYGLCFCLCQRSSLLTEPRYVGEYCSLRDLDLSHNHLTDSGLELLCDALKSPRGRLETLRSVHFTTGSGDMLPWKLQ
uniref:Pyrin domain-containing protein n=1 Tax=Labrus bergylta TaxID=56723 RepID=A0A3Q3G8R9_9LABR